MTGKKCFLLGMPEAAPPMIQLSPLDMVIFALVLIVAFSSGVYQGCFETFKKKKDGKKSLTFYKTNHYCAHFTEIMNEKRTKVMTSGLWPRLFRK